MFKKGLVSAAAAVAIITGATAVQMSPAEAGVTVQLAHFGGHGWKRDFRHYRGHRHGYFRAGRPVCFTRYKMVKVRYWAPRWRGLGTRRIVRPVTICR